MRLPIDGQLVRIADCGAEELATSTLTFSSWGLRATCGKPRAAPGRGTEVGAEPRVSPWARRSVVGYLARLARMCRMATAAPRTANNPRTMPRAM